MKSLIVYWFKRYFNIPILAFCIILFSPFWIPMHIANGIHLLFRWLLLKAWKITFLQNLMQYALDISERTYRVRYKDKIQMENQAYIDEKTRRRFSMRAKSK